MTPTLVRDRLQALPPELPDAPARFDRVRDRVRQRRRRQLAGVAATAALVVVASSVVTHLVTSAGDERGIGPAGTPAPAPSSGPVPGTDAVTKLADSQVHDGTGTQTVELGVRPRGATSVSTELTCLAAGRVRWPDGASLKCSAAEVPVTSGYVLDLALGQDELVIRAAEDVAWRIRTTYVRVETTDWGVNANGDTYGASNDQGDPDLLAVVATNGRRGYVYSDELEHASGGDVTTPEEALRWQQEHGHEQTSIPVYESDGVTVIGEFIVGGSVGSPVNR